jgi:tripartite-type tricarboxylate transporter receptor subunit TctC
MTTLYRAAIGMLAGIVLALGTLPARAQVYPSRPIHLIVPSSPGGSPDVLARLISVPLGEELGQPVIVETVTGAAGIIGTDKVAKATRCCTASTRSPP